MTKQTVLDVLAARKSTPGFGYGLGTAEPAVKRFLASAGGDALRQAGIVDEKSGVAVVKRASETLTWCDDAMVLEEKLTSSADFRSVLPSGKDLPGNTAMVIRHVLTTDREDRDSDVLRTAGAELDPRAPLLWQHMHTMPIGGVIAEVEHTDSKLTVVSALLDMKGAMGDIVKDAMTLIEADMLRFSHGFRIFEYEERQETKSGWPGFDIKRFEIMEASLVSVPSNVDAEIEIVAAAEFKSAFFQSIQKEARASVPPLFRGVDLVQPATKKAESDTVQITLPSKDWDIELVHTSAKQAELKAAEIEPMPETSQQEECKPKTPAASEVAEKSDPLGDAYSTVLRALKDVDSLTDEEQNGLRHMSALIHEHCADGDRKACDDQPNTSSHEQVVISHILDCKDIEKLKVVRDLAAGQIELCERAAIEAEYETLVASL